MNQVQQMWGWSLTGQYLRALAGVKFSQVGASECDELVNLLPEHLHADANVFIAQGCFCNVLDEHGAFLLDAASSHACRVLRQQQRHD